MCPTGDQVLRTLGIRRKPLSSARCRPTSLVSRSESRTAAARSDYAIYRPERHHAIPVDEYKKNIDWILRTLTDETSALVVVNLLPNLAATAQFAGSDKRGIVGRLTVRFNDVLERKVRHYGVEFVDLYERSRDEIPRRPELVASDGYHPSDLGYARWAQLMDPD